MRLYQDLKAVTFAAGQNSGGDLKLSQVPPDVQGKENYVNEIVLRLFGSITAGGAGAVTLSAGELTTFIQRVLIEVPGLRPLVNNVRGIDLHRIYEMRNEGDVPSGLGAINVAPAATQSVDFSVIIQFADPGARRYTDGAIPARLLKDANFTVSFESLANVHANLASVSLTLQTIVVTTPRAEVVIPSMSAIDAQDYAAGETQPVLPKSQAKASHIIIGKQRTSGTSNSGFANTDITTLGLRYGNQQVSQDSLTSGAFYAAFNEYATSDFVNHVTGTGEFQQGVPVEFPPLGKNGQHSTYELADSRNDWRLKIDNVASAYTVIRREVWVAGPWLETVRERLGIERAAVFKPQTASHKSLTPGAAEVLPLKRIS